MYIDRYRYLRKRKNGDRLAMTNWLKVFTIKVLIFGRMVVTYKGRKRFVTYKSSRVQRDNFVTRYKCFHRTEIPCDKKKKNRKMNFLVV